MLVLVVKGIICMSLLVGAITILSCAIAQLAIDMVDNERRNK